ncbi:hypothetical protein SNOG_03057 [Parastagonospora nodorum SN15]|uniref:Uncharacterized protein n=1 Tax=Phaeosphaeria nodorum (strain SN15 / ATCC MYA-4574 / FGSC 10173) TaxID=321614 RepID=Q0UYV7_PHANO|nr:hypothetical protein SNOG_03057 [Parastagonospora nodorum SN15]EAT89788.1 hypothetical protein SNOG_03057 [Parastagonospora nodorum SN15]
MKLFLVELKQKNAARIAKTLLLVALVAFFAITSVFAIRDLLAYTHADTIKNIDHGGEERGD